MQVSSILFLTMTPSLVFLTLTILKKVFDNFYDFFHEGFHDFSTTLVLIGSLYDANLNILKAISRCKPFISNKTAPGLTTATQ